MRLIQIRSIQRCDIELRETCMEETSKTTLLNGKQCDENMRAERQTDRARAKAKHGTYQTTEMGETRDKETQKTYNTPEDPNIKEKAAESTVLGTHQYAI